MSINIQSIYTRELHKELVQCIKQNKPFNRNINSKFITRIFIYNKEGVVIRYNTELPYSSGIKFKGFLEMSYEEIIKDFEKIYKRLKANNRI